MFLSICIALNPTYEHPLILECLRRARREDIHLLAAQMSVTTDYLSTHSILRNRSFLSLMYSVYDVLELDPCTGISARFTFSAKHFFDVHNFMSLRYFQTYVSSITHLIFFCFSLISPHTLRAEGKNEVKEANSSQRNSGTAFVTSRVVMAVETNAE